MTGLPPEPAAAATRPDASNSHVRGSTLLLGGRLLNVALDFVSQVVLVRYLSQGDYGAFAYGLSVASVASTTAALGFDKALSRFLPIFEERGEYPRLAGAIVLGLSTVLSVGLAIALLVVALQRVLGGSVVTDEQALGLLVILIFLAPLQALGSVMTSILAVFASARVIFVRRYLIGPALQLGVVLVVVAASASVVTFALLYLAAALAGSLITSAVVLRSLVGRNLGAHLRGRSVELPVRQIFGFSLPLLVSDVVFVLRSSLAVILLEFFRTTADVAVFRAAVPIARQNLVVSQSFMLLFTPVASRLFARHERAALNDLYWTTAVWVAVLSFPIFALTFSLAQPFTVLVYGERYSASAPILAVIALSHYVHVAFGFNGLMLRVYGQVRYLLIVDAITTVVGIAAVVVLIQLLGPIGAAIGVSATVLIQTAGYHSGLRARTDIRLFERTYLPIYVAIAISAMALALTQWIVSPPLVVGIGMTIVASTAVLMIARRSMSIAQAFPALLRVPGARWILGG